VRRSAPWTLVLALALAVSGCSQKPAPAPAAPVTRAATTGAASAAPRPPTDASRVAGIAFPESEEHAVAPPTGPQPAGRPVLTFLVYGDTRHNPQVHRQVVDLLLRQPGAAFACLVGDLVDDGSSTNLWQECLSVIQPVRARMPVYPALGNHDLPRSAAAPAFEWLGAPRQSLAREVFYYGFAYGPVRVAVLDSPALLDGDAVQLAWLRSFMAPGGAPLKVALLHHPLWSPGPHGASAELRKSLLPALRDSGVSLVFAGHDHMYYRTVRDGITQIVTAGGGAPLYDSTGKDMLPGDVVAKAYHVCRIDVYPALLTITALGLDGRVIDRVQVWAR